MAVGASGAAGGRVAGRTEGRSRAGRLSSWRAICLLVAWSRRAHEAGRSVEHLPCIATLTHSPKRHRSRRRPATSRPASRIAASAGRVHGPRGGPERRGRPQRALAEPPPPAQPPQPARAKAGQRCFGAWAETRRRAEGCRRAPSLGALCLCSCRCCCGPPAVRQAALMPNGGVGSHGKMFARQHGAGAVGRLSVNRVRVGGRRPGPWGYTPSRRRSEFARRAAGPAAGRARRQGRARQRRPIASEEQKPLKVADAQSGLAADFSANCQTKTTRDPYENTWNLPNIQH